MEIETEQPNTDVSIDMNGIENGNNDKSAPKATIVRKKVPTNIKEFNGLPQNVVGRGLHF